MQSKAISLSNASSVQLAASMVDIPWSTYDYLDHTLVFSDLGSITATVRIYPGAAGGNQYSVLGTTFTGDNKSYFFDYATHGIIGLVVIFDAPFTGTVYFGSTRPAVLIE